MQQIATPQEAAILSYQGTGEVHTYLLGYTYSTSFNLTVEGQAIWLSLTCVLVRSHMSARWAPNVKRPGRALALDTRAMVNVDFSPALLLGMSLIAGGLALYQLRRVQPDISRDFDVIVSAVATFSGGILIFQVRFYSTEVCRVVPPSMA